MFKFPLSSIQVIYIASDLCCELRQTPNEHNNSNTFIYVRNLLNFIIKRNLKAKCGTEKKKHKFFLVVLGEGCLSVEKSICKNTIFQLFSVYISFKYVDSSPYKLLGVQTFLKAFTCNSLFPLPHYWYRIIYSLQSTGTIRD